MRNYEGNFDDDNTGWSNEDTVLSAEFYENLPRPLFWRVMVAPVKPKEVSRGGIVMPKMATEAQDILNCVGKVVAIGPSAGKHERLGGDGVNRVDGFPCVGDYVTYGRYAGQQIKCMGVKILILNDDEILMVVPNPEVLQVTK